MEGIETIESLKGPRSLPKGNESLSQTGVAIANFLPSVEYSSRGCLKLLLGNSLHPAMLELLQVSTIGRENCPLSKIELLVSLES